MKRVDLTRQRFGLLVGVREDGLLPNGNVAWLLQCDCGGTIRLRVADLTTGRKTHCGCQPRKQQTVFRGNGRKPVLVRFWEKVEKTEKCWNWTGAVMSEENPYGNFNPPGMGYMQAHRFSYLLHYGPFPKELRVCHDCDNPRCVRPDHLFLGTAEDNSRDMAEKGRWGNKIIIGEEHKRAKLTDDTVRAARRLHAENLASIAELARRFNVCETGMRNALTRKTWKHVA